MTTPYGPRPTLDLEAVRTHFRNALRYRTPTAMWTALADIPVLLVELERVLDLLTRARTEFANVLAAARATLGSRWTGGWSPPSCPHRGQNRTGQDSVHEGRQHAAMHQAEAIGMALEGEGRPVRPSGRRRWRWKIGGR